jgi:transposase
MQVYSNGMTERCINKLKLIERQGYGRASFLLLRQRMAHALQDVYHRSGASPCC